MDGLEDVQIELHVTLGEGNLILAALSELPFKVSFGLIQKIKQQGEQQVASARGKTAESLAPPATGTSAVPPGSPTS